MLAGKRPHLSPLDVTPERIERLKQDLAHSGLRCEAVAGYTDFAGARQLRSRMWRCRWPMSGHWPAWRPNWIAGSYACSRPTSHRTRQLERFGRAGGGAPRVLRSGRLTGVTIAVQNHHDLGVHTQALRNCSDQSAPTAAWASTHGRRPSAAKTCTSRLGRRRVRGPDDQRRLHPAPAVPLPTGLGELSAAFPTSSAPCPSAKVLSITSLSRAGRWRFQGRRPCMRVLARAGRRHPRQPQSLRRPVRAMDFAKHGFV